MNGRGRDHNGDTNKLSLVRFYSRFVLLASLLEFLGAAPFLIGEAQRRSEMEFGNDCRLCFLILGSLILMLGGALLSIWRERFAQLTAILLLLAAFIGNLIFLAEVNYAMNRTTVYGAEAMVRYGEYWSKFLVIELFIIVATLFLILALLGGVVGLLKNDI